MTTSEADAAHKPVHRDFRWGTSWFSSPCWSAVGSRSAALSTASPARCTQSRSSYCSRFSVALSERPEAAWRLASEVAHPHPLN